MVEPGKVLKLAGRILISHEGLCTDEGEKNWDGLDKWSEPEVRGLSTRCSLTSWSTSLGGSWGVGERGGGGTSSRLDGAEVGRWLWHRQLLCNITT